jgi:glucose/arabinose dehydrogenase
MTSRRTLSLLALVAALALASCYRMRSSQGGGEAQIPPTRQVQPADVALPAGYRIEAVAQGLTFPTGVTFDDAGAVHVVESGYSYGEVWTTPRLLRIEAGRDPVVVAQGGRNGPWNGVAFTGGAFYVAEGGALEGGRILRITPAGQITALVENLPSQGDHHTNGPAVGPDGAIYFGQGSATNSGVVGNDNADFGWLKRQPKVHDRPCRDVVLTGQNYDTPNALADTPPEVTTGAFSPYGTATKRGQRIKGGVPCNGAIMKIAPAGGKVELVAWGFRNPFGLAFAPGGKLYVTDNGYDDRGSRPVWGAGDLLWAVEPGRWYGWPDYSGDRSVGDEEFHPPGKGPTQTVIKPPGKPPAATAVLGVHSSSNGFDFSRDSAFGHVGNAFIAQFGDQTPATGKVLGPVGFKVVRVDVTNGLIEDFAVNRAKNNGPASLLGTGGFERPVAARFSSDGRSLYVVDFGVLRMDGKQAVPKTGTGVLWRITREEAS